LEKAGLVSAFFFAFLCMRFGHPFWAVPGSTTTSWTRNNPAKSVDGMQQALEISARSSYVPSLPFGVGSGHLRKMRAEHGAVTCPEIATWMK
jgi:hypothetical protein